MRARGLLASELHAGVLGPRPTASVNIAPNSLQYLNDCAVWFPCFPTLRSNAGTGRACTRCLSILRGDVDQPLCRLRLCPQRVQVLYRFVRLQRVS